MMKIAAVAAAAVVAAVLLNDRTVVTEFGELTEGRCHLSTREGDHPITRVERDDAGSVIAVHILGESTPWTREIANFVLAQGGQGAALRCKQ